jgi:hypothetical protein
MDTMFYNSFIVLASLNVYTEVFEGQSGYNFIREPHINV